MPSDIERDAVQWNQEMRSPSAVPGPGRWVIIDIFRPGKLVVTSAEFKLQNSC
jgi:hypothetical protein